MGYHRAGFEVVGVDIKPQPRFPFEFHQADAMTFPLDGFDVIHASPPCQFYSQLRHLHPTKDYPDLLDACRRRLIESGKPYIIENVETAPLIDPVTLCGSMFNLAIDGYYLRRHRLFESNRFIHPGVCQHGVNAVGVHGNAQAHFKALSVCGHGSNSKRITSKWRGKQASKAEAVEAMDIDWMTHAEITQAIPPAYTEFLGQQILWGLK